ncbi:putative two-component histidine kinase [Gemmatimonas aurantiaca T-27]|uniref:histidine kinase n=2 Tax=Gemmatimonas aurantiaca TaxID=173480 RepID=C1A7P8_GEMAT|nr:putative two-component histidine kinase [Gemmatimonas aurantiaca T-27]
MTAASSIAPRRQLVARATALLFSVAAFSLVVVTWRSHGVVSGLLQDRISSDLAAHVIAIAGNVDAVITARLNDVQVAALNPAVVAVVAVVAVAAGDEKALPDARIALEALRQQDPAQFIGITLTDRSRRLAIAIGAPIPQVLDTMPADVLPQIITHTDTMWVTREIAYRVAVRDSAGNHIGALTWREHTRFLSDVLGEYARTAPVGTTLRVRWQNGRIIAAWPLPVRTIPVDNLSWTTGDQPGSRAQRWRRSVRERLLQMRDTGVRLRESAVNLRDDQWYIGMLVPEHVLVGPTRAQTRNTLTFSALMLAFMGAIIFVASRRVTRRITVLDGVVQKIAADPQSARVPTTGTQDELTHLGVNINTMADTIDQLVTRLENRGRELEQELDHRSRLEEQLAATRRLDSLGHLAGTVAHDFNNVLSIVATASESASDAVPESHEMQAELRVILLAAQRGREITKRLLSVARHGTNEVEVFDANACLVEHRSLFRRLLPMSIKFELVQDDRSLLIRTDRTQLLQAIFNLLSNARDAMASASGAVRLSTTIISTLPPHFVGGAPPIRSRSYVAISVQDSGSGMTPETIDRLGQLFFTTKAATVGNGLGIASVITMLRAFGGALAVQSTLGQGTEFSLILPLIEYPNTATPSVNPHPDMRLD